MSKHRILTLGSLVVAFAVGVASQRWLAAPQEISNGGARSYLDDEGVESNREGSKLQGARGSGNDRASSEGEAENRAIALMNSDDLSYHNVEYVLKHASSIDEVKEWILDAQFTSDRFNALGMLAREIAGSSIEEAKLFLEGIEKEGNTAGAAFAGVARVWGNSDPMASLEFAQSGIDNEYLRRIFQRDTMMGWATNMPFEAYEYAKSEMPQVRKNADAWYDITHQMAQGAMSAGEPKLALKMLRDGVPDYQYGVVLESMVPAWSNEDPSGALSWAIKEGQGDDSSFYPEVARVTTKSWSEKDAPAASVAISDMELGAARDGAISGLVDTLHSQFPADAYKWAQEISDEKLREAVLEPVIGRFAVVDPEGLANAIANGESE